MTPVSILCQMLDVYFKLFVLILMVGYCIIFWVVTPVSKCPVHFPQQGSFNWLEVVRPWVTNKTLFLPVIKT